MTCLEPCIQPYEAPYPSRLDKIFQSSKIISKITMRIALRFNYMSVIHYLLDCPMFVFTAVEQCLLVHGFVPHWLGSGLLVCDYYWCQLYECVELKTC